MVQLVDPFQLAMQNLGTFRGIQQAQSAAKVNAATLAKQEADKAQGVEMQNDLAILSGLPNANARDYAAIMLKYPTISEHIKKTYDVLDSANQKTSQNQDSQPWIEPVESK